jgi:hypothetical protein
LKKVLKRIDVAALRRSAPAAKVEDTLFDYVTRLMRATHAD